MLKEIRGSKYEIVDGVIYGPDRRYIITGNRDWEYENYVRARFWLDEDISDQRVIDWMYSTESITEQKYCDFLDSIGRTTYYCQRAEELLHFILDYGDGIICPNRWSIYEPINKPFSTDVEASVRAAIKELSFPQGAVLFKRVNKTLRCDMEVENGDARIYFSEEGRGKNKKVELATNLSRRHRGKTNITVWTKVSEIRKLKKEPIEFFDEFAAALKEKFALYKYYIHSQIDPCFYRKPTKEVIYYDIPGTHEEWRED